uniref:CX domain-containing protein n=1 Tax=Panagrellus redivivus TaxID=6233 RepID=A0A7E4W6A0_PANRE
MAFWIAVIVGIAVECAIACGDAWAYQGVDLRCPFGGPFSNDEFAAMEKRADGDSCVDSGAWEERRGLVKVFVPCLSAFQSCAIVRFDNATFMGGCFPDAARSPVMFDLQKSTAKVPKYDFTQPMRPVSPRVFSLSLGLTCQSIYTEFPPLTDGQPDPDQFYCKYGAVSWEGSYRIGRICCCKTTNCTTTVLNGIDEVDVLLGSTFVGDSLAGDDEPEEETTEAPIHASREERIAHAKARTPWKLFEDDVPALPALYFIGIAYGMICAHWTFIFFTTVWDYVEERRRRVY